MRGATAATTATAAPPSRWTWDLDAVADHLVHGHPLGDATFRSGRSFEPDRELVTGPAASAPSSRSSRSSRSSDRPPEADAAVEALRAAVARVPRDAVLSLSGGWDSRVLLAALLDLGRPPALVVSGARGTTDREVAEAIARELGLGLRAVEVTADRVAALAGPVAATSGGVLPATNAAGLAHLLAPAGAPTDGDLPPVLLGAGGELARTYYAARDPRAATLQAGLDRSHAGVVIAGRHPVPLDEAERRLLAPGLAEALEPDAVTVRRDEVLDRLPGETALEVADQFFLMQYGRRKTGADEAVVSAARDVHLPFFDPDWAAAVSRLDRRWKTGDRWHRHALERLQPALLDVPVPPGPPEHYLDQRMFRSGPLLDLVAAHERDLDDLVDPVLVRRLVSEQRDHGRRPHVTFALLALSQWRSVTA